VIAAVPMLFVLLSVLHENFIHLLTILSVIAMIGALLRFGDPALALAADG